MKDILSYLLLASITLPTLLHGQFTVSGRDILLNGADFEVNGLCYQPTPIGESGTLLPFGDYYTFSSRNEEIWTRDFANFRLMGANVIRIYGWTPGADHSDFLDEAFNNGEQSVYVLINRYINPDTDWNDEAAVAAIVSDWTAIADELKDHPAVMGFLIGNEINSAGNATLGGSNGDIQAFWDVMDQVAGVVKSIAPTKLVSIAITDRPDQVAARDSEIANFDFWAMQLYRGSSFTTFADEYAAASGRPVVITEFGYDALDGRTDEEWPDNGLLPAAAMEALWAELKADDADADVISGGCVFEYSDEWWKDQESGEYLVQNFGPRWVGPFEDGQGNEEWWGIFRIIDDGANIDILEPREMFYSLAAIWNPAYPIVLGTSLAGADLAANFTYPDHLRRQPMEVSLSTDLTNWTKVADNSGSTYLESFTSSLTIQNEADGEGVHVTLLVNPGAAEDPQLLTNGDFETGDTSGWATGGLATTAFAEAGNSSLQLNAGGGFSVPSAYQEFPASPGQTYNMAGYIYTESILPADATFGIFKIVFRDADGTDLVPASIRIGQLLAGDNPGGESLPQLNSDSPAGTWVFSEVEATAPANTAVVQFFTLNVDESPSTLYFDSIVAKSVGPGTSGNSPVFIRVKNSQL